MTLPFLPYQYGNEAALTVSGGSAWTPASLTGLLAWYKADAGVYTDAGSTAATDTQTVQQWNDQSGNAYNLSQATSGNRPQYLSGGFNSRATVKFTVAASTGMSKTSFGIGTGNTGSVFIVGQLLTATGNWGRAISYNAPGQDDYAGAGSAVWLARHQGNNAICSDQSGGTGSPDNISLATNYRLGMIYDGANVTPYVNNVGGTPATNSHNWATGGALWVGNSNVGGPWDGPISEVVVTNTALSSGDRTSLDNYFKSHWGL